MGFLGELGQKLGINGKKPEAKVNGGELTSKDLGFVRNLVGLKEQIEAGGVFLEPVKGSEIFIDQQGKTAVLRVPSNHTVDEEYVLEVKKTDELGNVGYEYSVQQGQGKAGWAKLDSDAKAQSRALAALQRAQPIKRNGNPVGFRKV
ncbi:hypothetical protein C4559_05310 [Candidatus Microgenomates bacterium]|nr:MAG: hypothetical protein C4559_05310 [Candidatus Microgenomates bacterium]